MAKRTKWTSRKRTMFLNLLREDGNVTRACRRIGMSRSQAYVLKEEDAEFGTEWEQAVEEGRENLIDEAEESMRDLIRERNVAASIFTLKTLGRSRGWAEKIEQENSGTMEIRIVRVKPNDRGA